MNLSSAWKPVFAKVSLRSKWISSLTGCDLKCLWAESELCVQSLSLFFSFPRLNKTICGWNNYLNTGDLIPHRNRSHFQVDVRSWQLQFHCRWWEWVEKQRHWLQILEPWWRLKSFAVIPPGVTRMPNFMVICQKLRRRLESRIYQPLGGNEGKSLGDRRSLHHSGS